MSQYTVLVIDDEIHMLRLIQRILKMAGFSVIGSDSGRYALEVLQNPDTRPDVITCDISLPDMDGFEVLRRIKSDADFRHIPVIMLTAMGQHRDAERAKEMGASDFLTKPFSATTLVDVLHRQLGKNRGKSGSQ
jgi:chemosensory pili system protein ChpA (sensor histidine kinase/response regulator)